MQSEPAKEAHSELLGGIEAGGTKFVCAIGRGLEDLDTAEIPTSSPEETLRRVVEFFQARPKVAAIGIASFGPLDLNPASRKFGYITSTPKTAWRDFDLLGSVRRALRVSVSIDTDVNAAALAESQWGAAQGLDTFLYVTVGTGIGGGCMANGRLLHGRTHPEMGHIRVPHDRSRDPFPGNCPYHGDCLEGLAAAPAIQARWGQPAHSLPSHHPAWELEAHYLALAAANWICTLAPERVILGGGVMARAELLDEIGKQVTALLNGYVIPPEIVAPALGSRSGVLGAISLAALALR